MAPVIGAVIVRFSLVCVFRVLQLVEFFALGLFVFGDVEVHGEDARELGEDERAHRHDERGAVVVHELGLLYGRPRLVADLLRYAANVKNNPNQCAQT